MTGPDWFLEFCSSGDESIDSYLALVFSDDASGLVLGSQTPAGDESGRRGDQGLAARSLF